MSFLKCHADKLNRTSTAPICLCNHFFQESHLRESWHYEGEDPTSHSWLLFLSLKVIIEIIPLTTRELWQIASVGFH